MNRKFIFIAILILVVIAGASFLIWKDQKVKQPNLENQISNQQLPDKTSNNNVAPENKNTSKQNLVQISKESIIVRKAIIVQRTPGQPYFTPYLKGYEDMTVKKGTNFAIEGFECESCSSILDLKLKLIDIKDNSIVVETQYTNWQNLTKEIKSGDQIDPTPGMMDVVNYFEFQIGNKDGQLLLTYKSGGASTMPRP